MSKIKLTGNSEVLTNRLQMYQAVYDTESQEVTLTCICDGTGAFLAEMQGLLHRIGCVDIQSYSDVNEQYGTKEKPWATCKFTAVGKLPVVPCKGEICIENRYEDSSLGYKCPVCNIEYGDNIYLYKGIPTFKQRKIPFSYCPNCGTKLKMEE